MSENQRIVNDTYKLQELVFSIGFAARKGNWERVAELTRGACPILNKLDRMSFADACSKAVEGRPEAVYSNA